MSGYKSLKVSELRSIAKSQGLKGWSRMRKDNLISFIMSSENFETDKATEVARMMYKRTVKELKNLARLYNVKIRSRANKSEIIDLLGENYGERRRALYERKVGLWNSEIRASEESAKWNQEIDTERRKRETDRWSREIGEEEERRRRVDEEITRWSREIEEEERRRVPSEPVRAKLVSTSMNGTVQKWFVNGSDYLDPHVFLYDIACEVKRLVDSFNWPKKVSMNLSCVLAKDDPRTGVDELDMFGGRSGTYTVTVQLGDMYDEMKNKMLENLSKFQKNGSGWRLKSIIGLEIKITKFDPMSGSGYSTLPPLITKKKAVINMMNRKCKEGEKEYCECDKCKESVMCFKWAVTRALNPVDDNPHRITNELREQAKKYNWSDITFPTKVKDISVWEKNNKIISVNVFGYDEDSKKLYTIRIGEVKSPMVTINLYLHDDNQFCVIRNLGRLVSAQLSYNNHGKDICLRCLNAFGRLTKKEKKEGKKSLLKIHEEICSTHKLQRLVYPKPGEFVKFRNSERSTSCADFESFVKPLEVEEKDNSKSFTTKYQSHVPSGFCYTIKCMDENIFPTKTVLKTISYGKRGEDMGKTFVDTLSEDLRPIYEILKTPNL